MTFYNSSILITVIMMIAMTIHVLRYAGFNKNQKIWYTLTYGAISFCALAELAVHCGFYDKSFKVILTILTILQFSVAPLLGILFSAALGLNKQKEITLGYFIINLLVEVICAPFGAIFKFDDVGYQRGEYFFIYSIFYAISLLYLVINMIRIGRKFHKRDIITIALVLVVIISGIIPMTFYKINITYTAIGFAAALSYIYYNDLVQQDIQEELILKEKKISQMQTHLISGMANLIENRDMETGEHIARTSIYVKMLSKFCKLNDVYPDKINNEFIDLMYSVSPLHDIGKVIIPDKILKKPGKLTAEEFEIMKKHASYGGEVVKDILSGIGDENYISFASDIAMYHHERWDGTGYPYGLKGDEIPLSARIMAIADVYDALISERCYKRPYAYDESFKIIEEGRGTQFDPKLVDIFIKYKDQFAENMERMIDQYIKE